MKLVKKRTLGVVHPASRNHRLTNDLERRRVEFACDRGPVQAIQRLDRLTIDGEFRCRLAGRVDVIDRGLLFHESQHDFGDGQIVAPSGRERQAATMSLQEPEDPLILCFGLLRAERPGHRKGRAPTIAAVYIDHGGAGWLVKSIGRDCFLWSRHGCSSSVLRIAPQNRWLFAALPNVDRYA